MANSIVRDDFDFTVRAPRQGGDLNRRARRKIGREIFCMDFIHRCEISKVDHEDRALDDVGEGQFLVVQNHFDVFQHTFGLGFDVARHEVACSGVKWNLPGAEKQIACADRMVIGSDGGRRPGGFNDGFQGPDVSQCFVSSNAFGTKGQAMPLRVIRARARIFQVTSKGMG